MTNKMTFGFRNVNGSAFNIRLLETPTGRMPSEKTYQDLRSFLINTMNKYGKRAEALAKTTGWSPYLTGALVRSIQWMNARRSERDAHRVIRGSLLVGVPYGRRQEYEHKTRGWYLHRAINAVYPEFISEVRNRRIIGDILFGNTRQIGSFGVRGGDI